MGIQGDGDQGSAVMGPLGERGGAVRGLARTQVAPCTRTAGTGTARRTCMNLRSLASFVVSLAITSVTLTAHAEDIAEPPAAETVRATQTRWYGWQTLSADGSAIALGVVSSQLGPGLAGDSFGIAALGAYAVAPSVIHAAHGSLGRAAGDIALRAVTPLVGGFVGGLIGGALYEPSDAGASLAAAVLGPTPGIVEGMYYGALAGAVAASAIDAAVLARETTRAEPSRPATVAWSARVAPSANGISAGIGGTF